MAQQRKRLTCTGHVGVFICPEAKRLRRRMIDGFSMDDASSQYRKEQYYKHLETCEECAEYVYHVRVKAIPHTQEWE